ncbi:MAG: hypothetical protein M0Z53_02860 [Thermaerobacter sp.]|nr:hypothetical protein [Thermaerobacter sp.]
MAEVVKASDPSRCHWPALLRRWVVTPEAAGLWVFHELVIGASPYVSFSNGPSAAEYGLPWLRWDVGFYAQIARIGYPASRPYVAAYFPGVPAYLWIAHYPVVALLGMQVVVLALIVQVGRLASAWGLTGWRVALAQALVALSPAAVFYSTAYPEAWMALGLCGMLLAMQSQRPWAAAGWAAVAGVMDPLGLVMGLGAGVWASVGAARRDWAAFRAGIAWGLGSVAALALVSGTLAVEIRRPFGFIGAQRAWGAHWLVPGVQIWQSLRNPLGLAAGARMAGLASLLVIIPGAFLVLRRIRGTSIWSAAVAGIAVACLLVPLAFYTPRG